MNRTLLVILILALLLLGGIVLWRGSRPEKIEEPPRHVGRESCIGCHSQEAVLWQGSHHDLAMDVASPETVLGDFSDVSFTHFGMTSRFFESQGKYFVHTDGPDGEFRDFEIKYTFGVTPLQQYLVEFPGGRLQVLGICWDSRPKEKGGQRWFHIYQDEKILYKDPLHWTNRYQNWNFMCAECHSTNLQRNYNLESDTYDTTWAEIDVSCEACHGPGSVHVRWAEALERGEKPPPGLAKGLQVRLKDIDGGVWEFDMENGKGTARRSVPRPSHVQVEACARCHSRRSQNRRDYIHGRPLLDTHRPQTLEEALYYPDGQILDEVYVYGSFIQSKMYHQGVTCSNCHNPHSLAVPAGNAVCFPCHLPAKFDTPEHHFHEKGSSGARCVECHMPTRTYMVVDPRRDHSIRIPRPDLSIKLETPNACNQCHTDQTARWAADAVLKWYGPKRQSESHYGEAIHAGRQRRPGAQMALLGVAVDESLPGIARATALSLLRGYPGELLQALPRALQDPNPLVRTLALEALETLDVVPSSDRAFLARRLLEDPVRAVRIEAARVLAPVARELPDDRLDDLERAIAEAFDSHDANEDRPEAHLARGVLYTRLGLPGEAEEAYRTALRLDSTNIEARVNLADLYRVLDRDSDGEEILREALRFDVSAAAVHHSLGLLLARTDRRTEAVEVLGRAARLQPNHARYTYVYAVALNSTGDIHRALDELKRAHERFPFDREILEALVLFHRDAGALDAAMEYREKLLDLDSENEDDRRLREELGPRERQE